MEPVYCPNGHPNRPGTRICIVCRELIVPTPPPATPPRPANPLQPQPPPSRPANSASPQQPASRGESAGNPPGSSAAAAPAKRRRLWPWLLLLLFAVVAAAALLFALLYPARRTTSTPPTQPAPSAVAIASDTATAAPAPTSRPTVVPSATPPQATATVEGSPTAVATITPLPTVVGVIITPTLAFGPEVNFIQNGAFADDWANGWTLESRGPAGEVEVGPATIETDTQSLRLARRGPGMSRLAQRVVLTFPAEGLVFRGRFRLAGTTEARTEGRAAVILRYEDANGDPVGASVWLDGSAADSDLWGIIPLPVAGPTVNERYTTEVWQQVELPLGREFAEALSGVDIENVRQITVFMAVIGSETCPPSACEAMLEVVELSITAEEP